MSSPSSSKVRALRIGSGATEALACAAAALERIDAKDFVGKKDVRATLVARSHPVAEEGEGPLEGLSSLRQRSSSALAASAGWLLPTARALLAEAPQRLERAQAPAAAAGDESPPSVTEALRRLSAPAGFSADMQLRRWGMELARRSLSLDQQFMKQYTAPALWSKWPKEAADAAWVASEVAADACSLARAPLEEVSPLKYVCDASFRDALAPGDTVLVKGTWLATHAQQPGSILPCRQELEAEHPEAVWDVGELMARLSSGAVIVVAISHCWLSLGHPDPDGQQLRDLGSALELLFADTPLEDAAVFFDWCSLHQQPRSEAETASFNRALRDVHLWYAHQGTRVWALSQVPQSAELSTAFEARGWPYFERALGGMVTQSSFLLDLGMLEDLPDAVETPTDWRAITDACRPQRGPPRTPEAFASKLQAMHFTKGDVDRDLVVDMYTNAFHAVLGVAEELRFNDPGWGDKEVRQLAALLPRCSRVRKVTLHGSRAGRLSAAALAAICPYCKSLEELWLTGTPAGRSSECREWLKAAWEHAGKDTEGLKF